MGEKREGGRRGKGGGVKSWRGMEEEGREAGREREEWGGGGEGGGGRGKGEREEAALWGRTEGGEGG